MRPLKITYEIDLKEISALIRKERDARIHQRLIAMKFMLQGLNIPEVARRMDVAERPLRKWLHRFNEHGPSALCDMPRSGQPPKLKPKQIERFKQRVRKGVTEQDNVCSLNGKIYSEYYKKNLKLNILLAEHISCFIALAFHAFALARNILNLTLKHKRLLKKSPPRSR